MSLEAVPVVVRAFGGDGSIDEEAAAVAADGVGGEVRETGSSSSSVQATKQWTVVCGQTGDRGPPSGVAVAAAQAKTVPPDAEPESAVEAAVRSLFVAAPRLRLSASASDALAG